MSLDRVCASCGGTEWVRPARRCLGCGVSFVPRRSDQLYHVEKEARAAASRAYRKRQREARTA